MPFTIVLAEVGTMTSAIGVGMMCIPSLATMDSSISDKLSNGTTQVVMAVFIIMLASCVVYLFSILMKTIEKGHKERDTREAAFSALLVKMELALQENTSASKESTRINQQCVDAMNDMKLVGKECREHIIRAGANRQG